MTTSSLGLFSKGDGLVPDIPAIPKIVYMLWLQGRASAPQIVKTNMDRWEALNPDYELCVLDEADVAELLRETGFNIGAIGRAAVSDIVRLELLARTGGVWVDATLFPAIPLSEWIDTVRSPQGFFAFRSPGADRPLASWFLVASEGNTMVQRWHAQAQRFWREEQGQRHAFGAPEDPAASVAPGAGASRSTYPYYWVHYLFAYLLETDLDFRSRWDQCADLSADPPHALMEVLEERPHLSGEALHTALDAAPLHKLNRRKHFHPRFLRHAEHYPDYPSGVSESVIYQSGEGAIWIAKSLARRAKRKLNGWLKLG